MDLNFNRQKVILILITAVLLFGIVFLAASLSQVELSQGQTFNMSALLNAPERFDAPSGNVGGESTAEPSILLTILFWVGVVGTIIYAFVSPNYRKRALFILIAATLFILVRNVIEQRLAEVRGLMSAEVPSAGELGDSVPLPQPPPFVTNPPEWIIAMVAGILALLLVAFGVYLWRQREPKEVKPDSKRLFVQEAEQALQALDDGADLKDVVLRCYVQMESVMRQSQEIRRQQSMTPREFEEHLLKAGFRDDHIGRLVRLFEEVRYGERSSDGRAEREARDCLTAIVASYG